MPLGWAIYDQAEYVQVKCFGGARAPQVFLVNNFQGSFAYKA